MINLFITLYDEKDRRRLREIEEALNRNIACDSIDNIYAFVEGKHFKQWKSINKINIKKRPTYDDFFKYVNRTTKPDDINVIANNDMIFDTTIELCNDMLPNQCYALTRWELLTRGRVKAYNRPDSQDSWIFKGKIREIHGDFYMGGVPGCDNRIAWLIKQAGYHVLNPAMSVRSYHNHASNIRHYTRKNIIKPPYHTIPLTKLKKTLPHKNILHIALNSTGNPQHGLNRALKSMGDYAELDWTQNKASAGANILKYNLKHRPDVTFMQLQTAGVLTPRQAQQMKGFVINWSGDVRHPLPQHYIDLGKAVDLTLFTNMDDIATLRRHGVKADYLQIGYDEKLYCRQGAKVDCADIVFLGNHYPGMFPLSKERENMVKILKRRYGNKFAVYGNGYAFRTPDLNNNPIGEAKILRSAKIVINISHYNYGRYTSDRLFRAMGCGAFVLSHQYKMIEKDFKNNEHLVYWSDIKELTRHIDKFLVNDKLRNKIALQGHEYVKNNHTWDNRIKELYEIIQSNT